MSKSESTLPAGPLAGYDQLIASDEAYVRKGKTTPYTSVNGHMYSFLAKDGNMGLRLSTADRTTFIEQHQTQLMEQHGRIMQEFVQVPAKLLEGSPQELSGWLRKSFNYTSALKPKPTKKK